MGPVRANLMGTATEYLHFINSEKPPSMVERRDEYTHITIDDGAIRERNLYKHGIKKNEQNK